MIEDTHTTLRTVCFSIDTVLPDHTFRHMRAGCLCQGALGVLSKFALLKHLSGAWLLHGYSPIVLFCLFALCHDASLQIRKALIFA